MTNNKALTIRRSGDRLYLEVEIMPISELDTMNYTDMCERVCERVSDMYCRIGDLEDALAWEWKLLDKRQRGVQ
jgi:hypothetical protein